MARVPVLHEDDPDTPPEAREFLKAAAPDGALNIFRVMANHPDLGRAFATFVGSYYWDFNNPDSAMESEEGRIDILTPAEVEIAYTAATVANNCFY